MEVASSPSFLQFLGTLWNLHGGFEEKAFTYHVNSIGSQEVEDPQKANIMPKANICSKCENLVFAVTTFGRRALEARIGIWELSSGVS